MRLLLVEDSERLRRSLTRSLTRSGYAVDTAADGREGYLLAEMNTYDVIILDIMLPELDGLSVLRKLREKRMDTHVLMLTAKDTVEDRVTGLQGGADDYLVKPFALEELIARVQALCRRKYGQKEGLIELGSLEIDTNKKEARCNGEGLKLSPREFRLLHYLAMRRSQTVSRMEIESHIYDDLVEPMSNVVDSAICSLRKKLSQYSDTPLIHTHRGFGYTMDPGKSS